MSGLDKMKSRIFERKSSFPLQSGLEQGKMTGRSKGSF